MLTMECNGRKQMQECCYIKPKHIKQTVMNTVESIMLSDIELDALNEIKQKVRVRFNAKEFILYGSISRNQADSESDIDLLIINDKPVSRFERHEITDIVFEVNLNYNTNFSTLVVDDETWESGMISVLPIKDEIMRDGIPV